METRTEPTHNSARYDFLIEHLGVLVKEIPGASFGYIGNLYGNGEDDRTWMVFLPHPGRIGTNADSIGSFRTNNVQGAERTVRDTRMFIRGMAFAKAGR